MKKLIFSAFLLTAFLTTKAQTITQTDFGVFTQSVPTPASFSSNVDRVNKTLVLSAGTQTTTTSNVRMFNILDMPAAPGYDAAPTVWLTVNNRNDYTRLKFRAVQNGESEFLLFDKAQQQNFFVHDDGNNTIRMYMPKANSRVMIGTSSDSDGSEFYSLSVNGNVRADRVKVYNTWADYVFEADYKLPTLEEVEQHIKEKGHLLDIPSAKEVEEKGIDLGDMDRRLLQKIEELTLYMIDLKKVNEKQAELIELLEKKIECLSTGN